MKRIFIILISLTLALLSGCGNEPKPTVNQNTESSMVQETVSSTSVADAPNSDIQNTEIETSSSISTEPSITSPVTVKDYKNTETKPSTSSTTSSEVQVTVSEETHNTESSTSSVYKNPDIDYATDEDTGIIADMIIKFVNEYRTAEGTCTTVKLSGLTEYAKYRSKQLVTNFAHDTFDERAAATALKYGKYVDPAIHGITGEPYYTANAREAIGKTDLGSTAENIAKHFARLVFNSKGHWSYVGGNDYKYIAVGITHDNGKWYCCIAMSRVNTDEPN